MSQNKNSVTFSFSFGLGSLIAVLCSWVINHSISYAIIHAILSWFYVIYWALNYSGRF